MPSIFVACAPGLEAELATELEGLGIGRGQTTPGGVTLRGGREIIYRANLESGLALKVLVRLGRFEARHFSQLEKRARALPWSEWLQAPGPVRVSARRSKLFHTGAIAERIAGVIEHEVGSSDHAGPEVLVRLSRDRCTVSVDTSGELLVRRGYRRGTGKAPLRADLARALVIGSGWDRASALGDPFCGSGTVLIEAGILAAGRAPGLGREFAFEQAPNFDAPLWRSIRARAEARSGGPVPPLIGSDRDAGVVEQAAANFERAGVDARLEVASLSASPVFAEAQLGALCSNPPYGLRVSAGRDLRALYSALAGRIHQLPVGCRLGLVVHDPALLSDVEMQLSPWCSTDHGGTKIAMMVGAVDRMS